MSQNKNDHKIVKDMDFISHLHDVFNERANAVQKFIVSRGLVNISIGGLYYLSPEQAKDFANNANDPENLGHYMSDKNVVDGDFTWGEDAHYFDGRVVRHNFYFNGVIDAESILGFNMAKSFNWTFAMEEALERCADYTADYKAGKLFAEPNSFNR